MWTRALLKDNAKAALSGKYWKAVGVCALATVLGAGGSYSRGQATAQSNTYNSYGYFDMAAYLTFMIAFLLICAITICISIFFINILRVGMARYFMENRLGDPPFATLFSAFRGINYRNIVTALFTTDLAIFGWSLLLIIPGIIKSYDYYLVPYLLAENPGMSGMRARELSTQMMEGDRFNLFVLGLSFFGWILLCGFTFGIGLFFLEPYMQATHAEFYAAMRAKAFASHMTTEAELGDFVRY